MSKALVTIVLIIMVTAGLILAQVFYFSAKEEAVEKGAMILFQPKSQESAGSAFEQIKKEILDNDQFKNLQKNSDWPKAGEKIVQDKPLPFVQNKKQ